MHALHQCVGAHPMETNTDAGTPSMVVVPVPLAVIVPPSDVGYSLLNADNQGNGETMLPEEDMTDNDGVAGQSEKIKLALLRKNP